MNYLFIHESAPAQFTHIIQHLSLKNQDELVFLSCHNRLDKKCDNVKYITVPSHNILVKNFRSETEQVIHETFLTGEFFGNAMMALRNEGFIPDIVYAHPGWGASMYVQDIFPTATYVVYCEWFYTKGEHFLFFKPDPADPTLFASCRQRNLCQLEALRGCDLAISPTYWQASQYPIEYKSKIKVLHDGIDTDFFTPASPHDKDTVIQGLDLSNFKEVVTYATRGLETYRGFPQFFKSIPQILKARPQAHIVIMANDTTYYSAQRKDGKTWKTLMLESVPHDTERVHFLKFDGYDEYLKLLRASTVHVYLTVPYVLSWSILEAMSCGCLVVASNTSPVREVIQHMQNGILTPFGESNQIAKTVIDALKKKNEYTNIRVNARSTILDSYDVRKLLPIHMQLLADAVASRTTSSQNIRHNRPKNTKRR